MTEEVAALMCATQSLNSQTRRKEEEATAVQKKKKRNKNEEVNEMKIQYTTKLVHIFQALNTRDDEKI